MSKVVLVLTGQARWDRRPWAGTRRSVVHPLCGMRVARPLLSGAEDRAPSKQVGPLARQVAAWAAASWGTCATMPLDLLLVEPPLHLLWPYLLWQVHAAGPSLGGTAARSSWEVRDWG